MAEISIGATLARFANDRARLSFEIQFGQMQRTLIRRFNEKVDKLEELEEAAHNLNRKPQTLRMWACYENGPLHPIRLNGRLHWRVSDIKTLLEGDDHA